MRIPRFWHVEDMPSAMSAKPLPLRELNPHLICTLCCGYLIDATTITECLHSWSQQKQIRTLDTLPIMTPVPIPDHIEQITKQALMVCKSCIVKHLEKSNFCPACDVQVHKAKPLMHIRPDRTLQDLVYKLVPELFRSEMARRKEFLSRHPQAGAVPEGSISSRMLFFAPNDQISLSLEYIEPSAEQANEAKSEKPGNEEDLADEGKKVLGKRYLCCPAAVTIGHLQKFIRLKYDLEYRYKVDILCHSELLLPEYRLLDVAYITSWTQEEPLRLFYRIYQIKHHYDYARAQSPKNQISADIVDSRKNDEVTMGGGGECAKIGSDAPPIEQTLPSNVTHLEEARGVKRQMPIVPHVKPKQGTPKRPRLEDISQSARLKLIAKAKSEKLNEKPSENIALQPVVPKENIQAKPKENLSYQAAKPKENVPAQSNKPKDNPHTQNVRAGDCVPSGRPTFKPQDKPLSSSSPRDEPHNVFKPISDSREINRSVQRNGPPLTIAKPTPKSGQELTKKPDSVKIPKPESKKTSPKGDPDLRPLRPDALPLPPIGRLDPNSPTKLPSKHTAKVDASVKAKEGSETGKIKSSNNESHSKPQALILASKESAKTLNGSLSAELRNDKASATPPSTISPEQPKAISEPGKVLTGKGSPSEKRLPELREIDKLSFLEKVDLTEKKEAEAAVETVSETLLSEIRDRALSKKSKESTVAAPSQSPPESIADIKEFISATSPENKLKQEGEIKSEEDPPSKRRKSTNGGTVRTMPNLIAISEIPSPLIARSMQTMAGSKKPEVKIIEAVRSSEVGKATPPKEGNASPHTSTIILDLSGKSSRSTSRSSSVGTPDDRKSPSPPLKRVSPPAVSITERVVMPKPSLSTSKAALSKSSPQPQNSPLPQLNPGSMFPFANTSSPSPQTLSRSSTSLAQSQMLHTMALAQRQQQQQQLHQFQAAMYAANAAKQAINATSPLTNRAEFERVRNMLTWNALAQLQNQRPAAPVAPEAPRPSTSKTPDKTPSSMMMKLPNVTRPKAAITKPGHDPINVRIKHFVQSQQNPRVAASQGPRAGLSSSVREIPNPSMLQQRRLTQLLHAGAAQDRVTITKAETQPSPKEIVETKLAGNKEITVSIVNPDDKLRKSPDSKRD